MDNVAVQEVHETTLATADVEDGTRVTGLAAKGTTQAVAESVETEEQAESAPVYGKMVHDLRLLTLRELFDMPDEKIPFVVEGLLPTSGSSIVHAKPKIGKSTLARQLALAVSRGEPFLGRHTCQGPVLYIALEEKEDEVKLHFRALGSDGSEPIFLIADVEPSKLENVLRIVDDIEPVLVIVDTLAKFLRINKINDYGPVNDSLRWMHEAARKSGAHFLAVHHAKKTAGDDPMDSLIGSTAFAGGVDTVIGLSIGRGTRVIQTNQRYGTSLEETALHFDPVSRFMSLGTTTREEEGEQKRIAKENLTNAIVEFVELHPGCREPEISAGVTGKGESKKSALRELLLSKLRREGSGRAGDPFLYFADIPVEPSTQPLAH